MSGLVPSVKYNNDPMIDWKVCSCLGVDFGSPYFRTENLSYKISSIKACCGWYPPGKGVVTSLQFVCSNRSTTFCAYLICSMVIVLFFLSRVIVIPRYSETGPRSLHSHFFMNNLFFSMSKFRLLPMNKTSSTYKTITSIIPVSHRKYMPASDFSFLKPSFSKLSLAALFQAKEACVNLYN